MIKPRDVRSLTDFTRNTKLHVKRLKRNGRPELLTVNGKAEIVVQSAAAYELLMEQIETREKEKAKGT